MFSRISRALASAAGVATGCLVLALEGPQKNNEKMKASKKKNEKVKASKKKNESAKASKKKNDKMTASKNNEMVKASKKNNGGAEHSRSPHTTLWGSLWAHEAAGGGAGRGG